jgi:hypothetical protein
MGRIVPAPLSGRLVISTTNRWLMPPANFLWATQILGKGDQRALSEDRPAPLPGRSVFRFRFDPVVTLRSTTG